MLAGISAGETIWCGLSAFLISTKLSNTAITMFGVKRQIGDLIGYKHGFIRRLFLYLLAGLINLFIGVIFYSTNIFPMSIWVALCCPVIVDRIISCKWFTDIESGIITHYLSKIINYLIKHGLDIHTQIQNTEIKALINKYYHGETDMSLSKYTSPISVVKFIYKSIKSINTDDTKRIITAIKKSQNIDPVLLWSIYKVWREKQNLTSMVKSLDKHIGYHVLEYTVIYAALWFANIYAAVAVLFALNAISRHRNAATLYKYNISLSIAAILLYQAQIYSANISNFIIDNIVCIMLSSGCLLSYLVNHIQPTTLTTRASVAIKSTWIWLILALITTNRFAIMLLIPRFYKESSKTSTYTIIFLMCGWFSGFNPIHLILLYIVYVMYIVYSDAALLLKATKVISEYTPAQFNTTLKGEKITSIIDNYL